MMIMRSIKNSLSRRTSKSPSRGSISKTSYESDTDLLCDRTIEFLESGDVCSVIGVELIEKSLYFEKLLKYHESGCRLQLPEFLNAGFTAVVEFIRKGQTELTSENVYDIFIAADYLLVPCLKQKCSQFISYIAEKNPTTAIRLWIKCRSLVWPEIGRMALVKILENFEQASKTSDFLNLPLEDVLIILENDQLNVSKECSILNVITKWINQDPISRLPHAGQLLLTVRLGMLTKEELDKFKSNELVKNVALYNEILQKWPNVSSTQMVSEARKERLNTPRLPHEVILAFGGWCDGEGPRAAAQVFNPRSNAWTLWSEHGPTAQESTTAFHAPIGHFSSQGNYNIGQIPRRVYAGCVILGSKVFLIGGFDGVSALKSTLCYDFETDSGWIALSCMYEKRYYVSVTQCDGAIYAIGGHNGENQGRLDSAERFNLAENQWHPIASMNRVRSDASAASLNGKVYIVGGFEGRRYHDTSEAYDPLTNTWTILNRMSTPRGGVSCVSHDRFIYAIGGNDGTHRLSTIERYDPITQHWEVCGNMTRPKSNLSSTVINDEIYIIGGWSDNPEPGILDSVEQFDIRTKQTQLVRNLCFAASATCACTLRDKHLVRKYVHGRLTQQEDPDIEIDTNGNNAEIEVYRSRSGALGDSHSILSGIHRIPLGTESRTESILEAHLRRNLLFNSRRSRRIQRSSDSSGPIRSRRRANNPRHLHS